VTDSSRAIENLIAEYAECIDVGDFAGLGRLLAHASVGAAGEEGSLTGADALQRLFEATTRRYEDGTPKTRHVTTNIWIEVDDGAGTAAARSSFTVLQAVSGFALQPIVVGRYADRFERVDGRWRFAERRFRMDLWGDVSHHLLDAGVIPEHP
jgi:hypothetical protein